MLDFIPNQKIIRVNRERVDKVVSNGRNYLIAYQDNLLSAMKDLTHTTFKIYVYLIFHKDGYSIAYSPEYIHKQANVCKETARKAFKELIEKGYIIETSKGFEFYEYPKYNTKLQANGEKREFVDSETGEIYHYTYDQLISAVGKERASVLWEGDSNVR